MVFTQRDPELFSPTAEIHVLSDVCYTLGNRIRSDSTWNRWEDVVEQLGASRGAVDPARERVVEPRFGRAFLMLNPWLLDLLGRAAHDAASR